MQEIDTQEIQSACVEMTRLLVESWLKAGESEFKPLAMRASDAYREWKN